MSCMQPVKRMLWIAVAQVKRIKTRITICQPKINVYSKLGRPEVKLYDAE